MIDLHTHSTASDGDFTPEKLVALALETGLTAIALTDHDTLAGLDRARQSTRGTSLTLVSGVEIEIETESGEFHLLGLGLSSAHARLDAALQAMRAGRNERNLRMVAKLQAAGFPISMEELREIAKGEVVSRAHFARLLRSKRIVSSIDAAFSRYLGKGKDFYESRTCLKLEEAAELIKEAGGVSVIAHPASLGLRGQALKRFLASARQKGVSGIEAHHPNHTLVESRKLEKMAAEAGLFVTGGSDFHGNAMPYRRLGHASGGEEIPDDLLKPIPLHTLND